MSRFLELIRELQAVSDVDLALLDRCTLRELSDAAFRLAGDADCELSLRGAAVPHRDEFLPH